jgi:LPXTG-motif cell wall-anchored protein
VIKDRVVKQLSVLQGSRTYEFSFAVDSLGSFTIDSIAFSFFNVDSGHFQTVKTAPLQVEVTPERLRNRIADTLKSSNKWMIWAALAVLLVVAGYLFIFRRRKKDRTPSPKPVVKGTSDSYSARLQSTEFKELPDKEACLFISQSIGDLIREHKAQWTSEQLGQLEELQKECRLLIYSSMNLADEREALTQKAITLFRKLE